MGEVRPCRDDERDAILAIVNAAAEAYRGVIPADRWHDPYMTAAELDREAAAGIVFTGFERDGVAETDESNNTGSGAGTPSTSSGVVAENGRCRYP